MSMYFNFQLHLAPQNPKTPNILINVPFEKSLFEHNYLLLILS